MAQALKKVVRDADEVGRLGGDEFVVVLAGTGSQDRAEATASRIRQELANIGNAGSAPWPTSCGDREIHVAISIGIASALPGDDLDRLLARADAEMYREKARRRTGCRGLSPESATAEASERTAR
ncbi:MAG: GGDEF domain-containing protein [Acidimicrobiia bacterium]